MKNNKLISNRSINLAYNKIRRILEESRQNVVRVVNSTIVYTYWEIGRIIVEEEQKGKKRAEYGSNILKQLSIKLVKEFGRGFDERSMISSKKLSPVMRELKPELTNMFKDTYVLDFLNLPKNHSEKDLRLALISRCKEFVLEFGKDFTFVGEEYRLSVGKNGY
ncbi:MAG: DUF1016 family protein [Nanoarchaeota archaeon]|nr:DUF1016 family protein [Nanoarchaeota archaeon]